MPRLAKGEAELEATSFPQLSAARRDQVLAFMDVNLFFQQLSSFERQAVSKVFSEEECRQGHELFQQGQAGEQARKLYIVCEGQVEHLVDGALATFSNPGESFGELAIILSTSRRTTARVSSSTARLLALDRVDYKRAMRDAIDFSREAAIKLLRAIPLFDGTFTETEMKCLVEDVSKLETFCRDDLLVSQHAPSDKFYLILAGTVRCEQKLSPSEPSALVTTFQAGDWFGEIALITDRPRAASIVADSAKVECLAIPREPFVRVFGPLTDMLKRKPEIFKRFVTDKV